MTVTTKDGTILDTSRVTDIDEEENAHKDVAVTAEEKAKPDTDSSTVNGDEKTNKKDDPGPKIKKGKTKTSK